MDVGPAIAPLFAQPGGDAIDAIALGCTHYSFLVQEFLALYPGISWFDPALPVAKQTLKITAGLPEDEKTEAQTAYFTGETLSPALLAPYGFSCAETFQS